MRIEIDRTKRTAILNEVRFIQNRFKETLVVPTESLLQFCIETFSEIVEYQSQNTLLTKTDWETVTGLLRLARPNLARLINIQRLRRGFSHQYDSLT